MLCDFENVSGLAYDFISTDISGNNWELSGSKSHSGSSSFQSDNINDNEATGF